MPLISGSRLGPYEVLARIGAGGMGEVWRARDSKLSREVAIKVLPAALADDAQYMARFEREAQVLASLNHPNIAAIYGIEQGAIVMELVAGEDLKGPVPVDVAIGYAKQIAAALEAAHEKGVVHRDLKPANVKVTADGVVKLLDFGLAKATEEAPSAVGASPTLALTMTQAGIILGTAAYMAPEQARGKAVDKRADIWAFGVVVYEMLTGRQLFASGDTVTDIIAAVVTREPDFAALPAGTPPHVRRLLERCLRKDPRQRLRDIGDARLALDEPSAVEAPAALPAARVARRSMWLLALAPAMVLLGVVAWLLARPVPSAGVVRFQFTAGRGAYSFRSYSPLISPDGKQIAYIGDLVQGRRQVFVRRLDALDSQPVNGTAGATSLVWSPDSSSICFLGDNQVRRVDLTSGAVRAIAGADQFGTRAAWSSRNVLLFNVGGNNPLMKVPDSGGTAVPATTLDVAAGDVAHGLPALCPDGRHFLFQTRNSNGQTGIRLGSLDSAAHSVAVEGAGTFTCAAVPGLFGDETYLLQLGADALTARRMDLSSGALGEVRVIASGSGHVGTAGTRAVISAARNGTLAYFLGSSQEGRLTIRDRSGRSIEELPAASAGVSPALSWDDRLIAVSRLTATGAEIWVTDLARKSPMKMLFATRTAALPVWSPDGSRMAFGCDKGICEGDSSGGSEVRVLTAVRGWPQQYTADGRQLLFVDPIKTDLELISLDGSRQPVQVAPPGPSYFPATISPGGGFVSYTSAESGQPEVYVRAMPPATGKWVISTGGGGMAAWSGDGKELFYLAADLQLMAVDVRLTPSFQAGKPKPLFQTDMAGVINGRNNFVVSRDGKRFYTFAPTDDIRQEPLYVILNWPSLLKGDSR